MSGESSKKSVRVPKRRFPAFRGAWETKTLETLGYFTGGGTPSKDNPAYWTGEIPWISSSDLTEESISQINISRFITKQAVQESATKLVPAKSILLISRVGVGKLAVSTFPLCTSQDFTNLTPTAADPLFLAYLLKSRKETLLSFNQGTSIKGFTKDNIASLRLGFPSPPEQQKIAECLSSVDELMTAQARKVDALKTHKKGLMQQLFPREGETQPRLRFPEFQNAGEWKEGTLDDLATFRRGSFPQPYGLPEWYDEKNGMPFIQVFDVGDDFRLKDKTKSRISKLGAEKSVFIPEGTLIVTLQGSIGRVAITHYDAYIDRTLLIFESFRKPIEKVFFARVIQNLFDIEKEKAPGGIIKTITKEALSDFKVKYPMIAEQQRIASCLSSLDALITLETQKLEALKTHKKGLMQQLFPTPETCHDDQ